MTTVLRTEVDWRRLSIRMLLVHPIVELGRALPVIFGLLILGSQRGEGGWWSVVGVAMAVGLGLLRWATTRYRITADQIEIQRGLLNRRIVTVPRDRVRTVDVTAHVLHRILGLVRVAVGTGESDRRKQEGLVLDGMAARDAVRLRDELLHSRGAIRPEPALSQGTLPVLRRETQLAKLSPAWILYGPFTLSGLVTIGVIVAFGWRTINESAVDPERVGAIHWATGQLSHVPVPVAVAEVVVGGLAVLAVLSTVAYVLAFWNFSIVRSDSGTLHISRGLLTTRATTIEERRLRGVELSEPLLLRAVGAARCIAITTGLRVGRGAERGGSLILPPAPFAEAVRVGGSVLSGFTADGQRALTAELVRHPRAALRRRLIRALAGAAILTGAFGLLAWLVAEPVWIIAVAAVSVPIAVLLAFDRYRSLGHAVVGRTVVFRLGSLVRRRSVLAADGVIGFTLRQSFFQRRNRLVTLTATTAAGHQHYELLDVRAGVAVAIADEVLPGLLSPFLAAPPQNGGARPRTVSEVGIA
jgi:putative membrane protein